MPFCHLQEVNARKQIGSPFYILGIYCRADRERTFFLLRPPRVSARTTKVTHNERMTTIFFISVNLYDRKVFFLIFTTSLVSFDSIHKYRSPIIQ
jgi:hypothetical protein